MIRKQKEQLLRSVERKFGKGDSKAWRNKDFEELSFVIHQRTKILISVATLKRLFGKVKTNSDYTPQESTTNALIVYSGFEEKETDTGEQRKTLIIIFLSIGIVVLSFAVWLFSKSVQKSPQQEKQLPLAVLKLAKVEGRSPSTAFFQFDVDSAYEAPHIHFNDKTSSVPVRHKKQISHFYPIPGNFDVKLVDKGKTISNKIKVLIPTEGWQTLTYYFEPNVRKRYHPVPIQENIQNGVFHASKKTLGALGIDTTKIAVVRIDNYEKTTASGDSFIYSTMVNNSIFWPAVRCFSIEIRIQGTTGKINFKFTGKGCSAYCWYVIGEKDKEFSNEGISNLTLDLKNWQKIKIKNKNKQIVVQANGKTIFKDFYTESIGDIVGTSLFFHGSGFVDYIRIKDLNGKIVFKNNF